MLDVGRETVAVFRDLSLHEGSALLEPLGVPTELLFKSAQPDEQLFLVVELVKAICLPDKLLLAGLEIGQPHLHIVQHRVHELALGCLFHFLSLLILLLILNLKSQLLLMIMSLDELLLKAPLCDLKLADLTPMFDDVRLLVAELGAQLANRF